MIPAWLAPWRHPAPDSMAMREQRLGRPAWTNFVHLAWTSWVFLTPLFTSQGYDLRWTLLTLLSFPLFLWLYATSVFAVARRAQLAALAMAVLCLALLRWYPAGLSYFVFGCVMLQPRDSRSLWPYLATIAVLNLLLLGYARFGLGLPWQALAWIPVVAVIIGSIVMVERMNRERDAALKLSHDEVRRLAALAERERIGRDLHDLLGHTLSMVALKSDLAGRLLRKDPQAAGAEIADVSRIAREALAQVRGAVSGIRGAGIAAELASAKLLLETDGIAFDYRVEPGFEGARLPAEVESALAMALREAATNIQRHARASRASASFLLEEGEAVLRVQDDGRGGALVPGNGLAGMRERIEALRGRLRVEGVRGGGVRLEARVPLAA